jgi:putative Ca2+/H+ antiporter (TMEM165/GDT1 family)
VEAVVAAFLVNVCTAHAGRAATFVCRRVCTALAAVALAMVVSWCEKENQNSDRTHHVHIGTVRDRSVSSLLYFVPQIHYAMHIGTTDLTNRPPYFLINIFFFFFFLAKLGIFYGCTM